MIKPLLILVAVLILLAVVTGRANAIFALLGGLIAAMFRFAPIILKFYPQIREILFKFGVNMPAGPGSSRMKTATLDATLDPLSGKIDGKITSGEFAGQKLSTLSVGSLEKYYKTCMEGDPQALRLIEAFVRNEHPEKFQNGNWNSSQHYQQSNGAADSDTDMSTAEAREILGVNADASKQEITYAHRKLMAKLHPDKGGSTFLATRVNLAKDTLLGQLAD